MSRKFLVPIDLTKQELQNARIQNLASAPASPVSGQIYYDTADATLYFYDGSAWIDTQSAPSPISYGLFSARPTASTSGANTLYYATDNGLLYISDGTNWSQISQFGSGQSTSISIGGSASDGSSTNYARADHAHGAPSFGNVSAQTSFGGASSNGSATTVARSDHQHGTPAHDASAHSSIKISDLAAPSADVSFGNFKITSLATPTVASDAATKEYVDAVAEGLHIHASCEAATTGTLASITGGSVTYNNGTSGIGATLTLGVALTTLDGYTLQNGDRILVKDQASQLQNGIYTWATGGTVLTRATDFNTAAEIAGGDFTFVTNGTSYNNTGWVQTEAVATVGTDSVIFQQFSGAGTYTASNGVTLSGSDFQFAPLSSGGLQTGSSGASIKLQTNSGLGTTTNGLAVGAGTGITVTTGTVSVDTSVVARKYAVSVGDGSAISYTVTHNLGTTDCIVQVYTNSDGTQVETDVTRTNSNVVTIAFSSAPTSNQYRVVVFG